MPYQKPNLGMLELVYTHHYYRKPETPRFLRNPSTYLTTTKIIKFIKTTHTEGPSSVPKPTVTSKIPLTSAGYRYQPQDGKSNKIYFYQLIFADAVKHHCWEDWPSQTRPEKTGQDTAHTQPTPRGCSNKNFKRLWAPTPQPDKQQIKYM